MINESELNTSNYYYLILRILFAHSEMVSSIAI